MTVRLYTNIYMCPSLRVRSFDMSVQVYVYISRYISLLNTHTHIYIYIYAHVACQGVWVGAFVGFSTLGATLLVCRPLYISSHTHETNH